MADESKKPSWIDYLNLILTVAVGVIGIVVAVRVSDTANQLSQNGLSVTTATFLLDDAPRRQLAGVEIVQWLSKNQVPLPPWEQCIVDELLKDAVVKAPSNPEPPVAQTAFHDTAAVSDCIPLPPTDAGGTTPPPTTPTAPTVPTAPTAARPPFVQKAMVADQLFKALSVSGRPRLFIQIAEEDQRAGALALRQALGGIQLAGQPLVMPGVERVAKPSPTLQLRYLKSADAAEASTLAADIQRLLLGAKVELNNLSPTYDNKPNVAGRTYELWFPIGQAIKLAGKP